MRILFMGTPDYSVNTLEALYASKHEIVGVFTQPDKLIGRKQILTPPPVKICAQNHGTVVFQPDSLRNGDAFEIIKGLSPDVIVVVAYGKILPKEILELPKYGCINAHASLLPRHRGASPIQWAIVCGDRYTGVTTMLMDEGMDTGDIIEVEKTEILPDETAEQLFERLSVISAQLMLLTIEKIENKTAVYKKQPETGVSYAPIIKKEMAHIDFSEPADKICCAVRGYYSWPVAYFILNGKRIKVICARQAGVCDKPYGTVADNNGRLVIACGNNTSVEILTVQPEGGKQMSAVQMLCGHKIEMGTVVE